MGSEDGFDVSGTGEQAYEEIAKEFHETDSVLRAVGLRLPGGGRYDRYGKAVSRMVARKSAGATPHDLRLLQQATLELGRLRIITRAFSRKPEVPQWRERIRPVLAGTLYPSEEKSLARPRDIEFELFLGAVARLGGCEVELPDPPDVKLILPEGELSIAAKRPKSTGSLTRRVSEAGKQIGAYGLSGVIAIDLSILCNPNHRIVEAIDADHARLGAERSCKDFLEKHAGYVRAIAPHPLVIGLMVAFSGMFEQKQPRKLGSMTTFQAVNLCGESDQRLGLLNAVMGCFRRGALNAFGVEEEG